MTNLYLDDISTEITEAIELIDKGCAMAAAGLLDDLVLRIEVSIALHARNVIELRHGSEVVRN